MVECCDYIDVTGVTGPYLVCLCVPGEAGSLGKEAAKQLVRGVMASVLSCPK